MQITSWFLASLGFPCSSKFAPHPTGCHAWLSNEIDSAEGCFDIPGHSIESFKFNFRHRLAKHSGKHESPFYASFSPFLCAIVRKRPKTCSGEINAFHSGSQGCCQADDVFDFEASIKIPPFVYEFNSSLNRKGSKKSRFLEQEKAYI